MLVSKDINIRIKAHAMGLPAEDYFNDQVIDDADLLYTGSIQIGWQGCADAGLCYPPQTQQIDLSGTGALSEPGTTLAEDQALVGGLLNPKKKAKRTMNFSG